MLNILMLGRLYSLVFIDESGFRTHMGRHMGRGKPGTRVVGYRRRRSKFYTLIGAMSLSGMVGKWLVKGYMDQKQMVKYINEILIPELPEGSWVIWDNCSIHRAPQVQYQFYKAKVPMFFQSRYSPDFNPIEQAWTKIKTLVRGRRPRGAKMLREAVDWAWHQIDTTDIRRFFRHAGIEPGPPLVISNDR